MNTKEVMITIDNIRIKGDNLIVEDKKQLVNVLWCYNESIKATEEIMVSLEEDVSFFEKLYSRNFKDFKMRSKIETTMKDLEYELKTVTGLCDRLKLTKNDIYKKFKNNEKKEI